MANFDKLRGDNLESFITDTIVGLKAVKREAREAVKELKELEKTLNEADTDD